MLCTRDEFVKVSNLATIDVLSVKLWLDSKVSRGSFNSNYAFGFQILILVSTLLIRHFNLESFYQTSKSRLLFQL